MTVQELIDALLVACSGRDPSKVQINVVHYDHGDSWPYYTTPAVKSFGGNEHPFEVTIE